MKKIVVALVAVALFIAAIVITPIVLTVATFGGSQTAQQDAESTCLPNVSVGGSYSGGTKTTDDLAKDWAANAQVIIGVANQRGLGVQGAVVGLSTAMQESKLGNINYGDRDSLGLFQQRPSQGWGRPDQLLTPSYAAGKFYDVLVTVQGWETMPVTVAAQRVQRSGHPTLFAQWEGLARAIVAGGTSAPTDSSVELANGLCQSGGNAPVSGDVAGVITAMEAYLGLPYSWGGGTLQGPSRGFAQGANTVGFDCSSYVRYGYYKATGVAIPRTTRAQYAAASIKIRDRSQLQPGDLLFFASNTSNPNTIHHVSIYTGNGRMLHEPKTGDVAKYVDNIWASSYWSGSFIGAIRPLSDPAFTR